MVMEILWVMELQVNDMEFIVDKFMNVGSKIVSVSEKLQVVKCKVDEIIDVFEKNYEVVDKFIVVNIQNEIEVGNIFKIMVQFVESFMGIYQIIGIIVEIVNQMKLFVFNVFIEVV